MTDAGSRIENVNTNCYELIKLSLSVA